MKHTKKRLLAVLLVLAMALGMAPLAALTVGAEAAIVETITVDENGMIQDLDWTTAFVASPYHNEERAGKVVKSWSGPYRLSEIVIVPKAGTTLTWTDPVANGSLDAGEYFLTSWKSVGENKWELDPKGANLVAAGLATNDHQVYDEVAQTVTYVYTTTRDNEALRFAAYGYTADGELSDGADECPAICVCGASFAEGKVNDVRWNTGAVVAKNYGATVDRGIGGYVYSDPIAIPAAGTTVSWNGLCAPGYYAISVWRAADNGALELVYGCEGGYADNAWLKVTETEQEGADPVTTYTYAYTSSYDNEFIRICGVADATSEIAYIENNAANHAPILKAAGYDPAQAGTPYMVNWYSGLVTVETDDVDAGLFLGGDDYAYRFSDVIPVYAAGTKVTFVDVLSGAEASADELADENVYVVAKFDGSGYTGPNANNVRTFLSGAMVGDVAEDRAAAVSAGKRVYTYTTTDPDEYLRLSYCCLGNEVNGGLVAPIIYISTPADGYYYSNLEGLTVYSVLTQESGYWGDSYNNYSWLATLAARYGWNYSDYGIDSANDDVSDADILIYHAIGAESIEDVIAVCEEETLVVFITDNKELADEIEAVNGDYVCAVCVYDLPYRVTRDYATCDMAYLGLYAGETGLNVAGHALLTPWLESLIGESYANFGGIMENDTSVVKFVNGDNVTGMIGTSVSDRTFAAPGTPRDVAAENMFGWAGVLNLADGTSVGKIFRAGEQVTVPQGSYGTFEALYVDMDQLSDAELRVDETSAGLRFLTAVSDAEYKALLEAIASGKLGDGAAVTLGTLIVPDSYLKQTDGELTHASLAAAELNSVDVASNVQIGEDGKLNWYSFDGTNGYLAGTINEILGSNYNKKFTARGYAKLTVGGVDYYVYATRSDDMKGVAIYEKAYNALNDCANAPKEGYPNKVETLQGEKFSPYTEAERSILKSYAIGVVAIKDTVDPVSGKATAELVHGTYYDPNARRNCFTVVGGGEDSLTDIFTENGGRPVAGEVALQSADWSELLQALGDDGTGVDSICVITVANGYEATAILLGGIEVEFVEHTVQGKTCYLIGFSNYTPFY